VAFRIGIAGIQGRMGGEIAALAVADPDFQLVGGISREAQAEGGPHGVQIVADAAELLPHIDVLIDFSAPEATVAHARACAAAGVPLVSGTTGLEADQVEALRAAAEQTAIFHAANMSPGVNAALAVLPTLVRALPDYDLEIVESHHRQKVDAPSGTALLLARVAADAQGIPLAGRERYGRHGSSRRLPQEIGIHAVRGGGNPGEHTVILTGPGEEIRLSVRAFDRSAYAQGALQAARSIVGQPPGWYEPTTLPGFLPSETGTMPTARMERIE
jgi:4-hydroxy-tetrahydrodipicolinate reductase